MSVSDFDRADAARFDVRASRDGDLVEQRSFATLDLAEAFMEEWSEQHPGDQLSIDDHSVDHTAYELVEDDTALDDGYGRDA